MTSDHKGLNQIPEATFERRLMKAGLFNICTVHAASCRRFSLCSLKHWTSSCSSRVLISFYTGSELINYITRLLNLHVLLAQSLLNKGYPYFALAKPSSNSIRLFSPSGTARSRR